jgi:cytochrome c-type biogenesis protein CcmH/NrfG
MKNNVLFGTAGGLLVGLLAGYIIGFEVHDGQARAAGAAPQGMGQPPAAMGQMPPGAAQVGQGQAAMMEAQQRIDMNQKIVAQDPRNIGAWISLGNDLSDTRQFAKAIDAYNAALKLQPNNPDVITDLGVVYEQLADYDKALAAFERAQQVDPKHLQSLMNVGVIEAFRKNNPTRAIQAWKRVIELAPTSPQAADARQRLAALGAK